ncbi:hypothetical protein BRD09_03620 [Halobacteriales archaeon SW_10_68_16]|nr:MAG: hypothetical protein BRD09_03620 [Halobacteriales archaeon SW_10_68_16]
MSSDSDDSRLRDEHGRYVSEVTPEDVLDVFESVPGPTITTSDVVEELDCSREVARNRLTELAERGLVERRKSGRVVLWWRGDDAASNPYAMPPAITRLSTATTATPPSINRRPSRPTRPSLSSMCPLPADGA